MYHFREAAKMIREEESGEKRCINLQLNITTSVTTREV